MEEKILYVELPKGANLQRVIVTGSSTLKIVYSEECACKQSAENVPIPKPTALVGGCGLYQKDDVPYWYCNIKDGRDAFMHLYMEDLTEHDLLYDSNGNERSFSTPNEIKFKENCLEALANKPKEGFRWLPVYEISAKDPYHLSGLQFVKGEKPATGEYNCHRWEEVFKAYSPENGSAMCSKATYFLLLLRWLKDGIASLDQLANHSEEIGNYYNSLNPSFTDFEETGKRKCGGLYGFVGNTLKIIKDLNSPSGYSLVGGCFLNYGEHTPVANIHTFSKIGQLATLPSGSKLTIGLIELK